MICKGHVSEGDVKGVIIQETGVIFIDRREDRFGDTHDVINHTQSATDPRVMEIL